MLSRSLRISNRRFKDVSGWAPRHGNALDGFRAVIEERHDLAATSPPRRATV